ncbi:MAG: conjugal transfer protein TraF [Betaproteobacteria bacterium]|nr:conjugal transfer protein TraF [Betaproteobacteria bacterium]
MKKTGLLVGAAVATLVLGGGAVFAQQAGRPAAVPAQGATGAPGSISDVIADDAPVTFMGQQDPADVLDEDPAPASGAQPQAPASNDPNGTDMSHVPAARGAQAQTGDDFYCAQRRLGTWFYCDKPPAPDKPAQGAGPQLSASARVKAVTRKLEELRDRAILEPTEENVTAYIEYQNQQSQRASTLADAWERALIRHPELDYNQQRPISTLGKQVWSQQREAEVRQTMLGLNQRYGIFFFYSSNCPACDAVGPVLASLRDNYGWSVVGVTKDFSSELFPSSMLESGQRQRMGLPGTITPAIALYDTVEHRAFLIGSGVLAADEIIDRIFLLTQRKVGEDY